MRKYHGLNKIRSSHLPHRIKEILEVFYWKVEPFQGSEDTWEQLMDLLHGEKWLLDLFNLQSSTPTVRKEVK